MAEKVAVITDSIACLTKELVAQYGIRIVPIILYFEDRAYKDWVDITPDEAYEIFLKDPDAFKTSGSSPQEWMDACRAASRETDSIICITLSSKLSSAYNGALDIKKRLESEVPALSVAVVDSNTVTATEGFVVLAAARAAAEGKSLAEVIKAAEEMKKKVGLIAFLDTIRHVYRTGRIPKIAALAGSVLNIRPVLAVSGGVVRFIGVVRSRERGIRRLIKTMKEKVGEHPVHVAVMHAFAPEEGKKLKDMVAREFNCVELWLTGLSPVMGYAAGTGMLGLAYYKD
ncbi:MAG: DegV family protein [Dehalococcoidia bacterium]|jgi:DegV family protein with EDD domain